MLRQHSFRYHLGLSSDELAFTSIDFFKRFDYFNLSQELVKKAISFMRGTPMPELIHTSKIKIYQDKRPVRRAYIENFEEPVLFGVHGGIKHFYKMEPEQDIPATLDYMVPAVGG